jgi:fructosamine-3-kinase
MPGSEADISWAMLRQVVRDWAGADAELRESRQLDGGSVNTTLDLTLGDGRRAVLKITPHRVDRSYADEAHQLALLRSAGVPTPDVYAVQTGSLESPYSYLLMEYVDGVDLHAAKGRCGPDEYDGLQRHLAEVMLRLHATTGTHFMRACPAADVPRFDTWAACYRDIFDGIWREVGKTPVLPVKLRKAVGRVHDRLDRLLCCDGPPRLLHWDAWSTNLLARRDDAGRWRVSAVLDPNCKYGSVEAEMAYLDLFHTATPAFFKAYQHERKLPPDYHQLRKPIYHLYSMLNHVRCSGTTTPRRCAPRRRRWRRWCEGRGAGRGRARRDHRCVRASAGVTRGGASLLSS